jgi:hypothetical protein
MMRLRGQEVGLLEVKMRGYHNHKSFMPTLNTHNSKIKNHFGPLSLSLSCFSFSFSFS